MEYQPQPPKAEPETPGAGARAAASRAPERTPVPRRYPKPPPFLPRVILLCLRPESWPEAARYPTWVTLVPLLAVILLGAAAATTGQAYRQVTALNQFVATYDQTYPPMELSSDGILRVKGELRSPVRVPVLGGVVLVDPTGNTNLENSQAEPVMGIIDVLITDKNVVQVNRKMGSKVVQSIGEVAAPPFGLIQLPPKGQVKEINGATLKVFLGNRMPVLAVGAVLWAMLQGVGEVLWAVMVIFLLSPVIAWVAAVPGPEEGDGKRSQRVLLPRRAVVRMVAAFLVPLVVVGGVLRATGHPLEGALGVNGAMFFWLSASLALAIWTGVMARRMYGVKRRG